MGQQTDKIDLLRGTLDMLILRTLQLGRAHGHQIARHIQRSTDDVLQIEHGSLYPALHRLERKGWLASKWEAGDGGRSPLVTRRSDRAMPSGPAACLAGRARPA